MPINKNYVDIQFTKKNTEKYVKIIIICRKKVIKNDVMEITIFYFYFKVEARSPLHIFAYRAHAHSYGSVISGYMYNEAQRTWSLVAKGNPRWPQAFYPIKVIRGVPRNLSCGGEGGAEPQEPPLEYAAGFNLFHKKIMQMQLLFLLKE